MGVGAFPEQSFLLRGDPHAIAASATTWSGFAGTAQTTADDLRALDADDFTGDEADTYRGRLNTDLPPYLDTTSQAWTIVGAALDTHAATLADLQDQLGRNLRKSMGLSGRHDVIAHGYVTEAEGELGYFAGQGPIHPAQVAEAVRGNPNWSGQGINPVACGGARGAGQALADELGVEVYASDGYVALNSRGENVEQIGGVEHVGWQTGRTFCTQSHPGPTVSFVPTRWAVCAGNSIQR